MSEILIVRHGQASFGTDDYDRLSETGWQQSRVLGAFLAEAGYQFDACFTGDMRRHRETLSGISESFAELPVATELPGLNEYDFHTMVSSYGRLVGEIIDQRDPRIFYQALRQAMLAWSRGELSDIPESWDSFEQRVQSTLSAIAEPQGRVLVVTSGGASSAILRTVLGVDVATMIELNLQARNTAVSYYFCKNGRFKLNSFNTVSHLDNPQYRNLITYT
ncbi:histidine phosphatase family protein [Spongiibacter sp. KMU-158]|uniref:Histidine phosphatase family protein n=1 Tax=Spongiibacter pelagi TaxID=2760804 RepID=A0A927C561_9GAMM|nr:histidine phosphatase family protein [Spongiibacter pelagi]MBD2859615.1 histidine phosphatase family protein [Spongiibacter pelagi]